MRRHFLPHAATLALIALLASAATAAVNFTGDVKPASTPFGVIFIDEDGDFISDVLDDQGNQVFFGIVNPNDPTTWNDIDVWVDYDTTQNILVGEVGVGTLEINGGDALRYQHLILGGSSELTGGQLSLSTTDGEDYSDNFISDLIDPSLPTSGVGIMTVTGFGSTFNNAPGVIPTALQAGLHAATGSTTPQTDIIYDLGAETTGGTVPLTTRELDGLGGFDVHVGLLGQGILNVELGGRVEIQDALFVGLGDAANGTVNVDGFGSTLTAYGRTEFDPSGGGNSSTPSLESASLIGASGQAKLNITNRGQAFFRNGLGIAAEMHDGTIPGNGATGTVVVDGSGSSLTVNATSTAGALSDYGLVVGGFQPADDTFITPYEQGSNDGIGLLQISDTATVRVTYATDYGTDELDANVGVGNQGGIALDNGSLTIENRLESDGTIGGDGQIVSGTFYNRALGRVSVGAGETLSIISNGDTDFNAAGGNVDQIRVDSNGDGVIDITTPDFFQANVGVISVDGGELIVGRTSSGDSQTVDPVEGFRNGRAVRVDTSLRLMDAPISGGPFVIDSAVGTITSDNGALRFENGIINSGVMAFVGGDNVVGGPVENEAIIDYDRSPDIPSAPGGLLTDNYLPFQGVILVSGDGTTVTFEDHVVNDGVISIGPHNNVVNFLGDLDNSGTIKVASNIFGFGVSESAFITVSGDVTITGGTIDFAFLSDATLTPDVEIALLTADGDLGTDSLFTDLVLPDLEEGLYWNVVYDFAGNQIVLEIVESDAIGADFSGDGIVNAADIDIWIANAGINSGASIIQGDADFDGDVDLADYQILMDQVFTGVPVAIPGGGGGSPVPEPAAAMLAVLAMAGGLVRRRR